MTSYYVHKLWYLLLVSILFTTIIEKMLFEHVENKVNIKEKKKSLLLNKNPQILILHI